MGFDPEARPSVTPRHDPTERLIEAALTERGLNFVGEGYPLNVAGLDFHLPPRTQYQGRRIRPPRKAKQRLHGRQVSVAEALVVSREQCSD